jgi:hypothetical protein
MITALQNLISKRGKFIFIPLLLVIVVSFVLYLSQGSSVFDFLPDSQREKMEYFGHDLNDNAQMSSLNAQNRVAASFGFAISPFGEVMSNPTQEVASNYLRQLRLFEQMIRSGGQSSNTQFIPRYRQLGEEFQKWQVQSKNQKASQFILYGINEPNFSQTSIRGKLALNSQAEDWDFLPLRYDIKTANKYFTKMLISNDPVMEIDANRTQKYDLVGKKWNLAPKAVESILYSHFRANLVDEIYTEGGFVLDDEAEIDLRINDFAWDAEALSLNADDLNITDPHLVTLSIKAFPKAGDTIDVSYFDKKRKFVFVSGAVDINASNIQVSLGQDIASLSANLIKSLEKQDFGFSVLPKSSGVFAFSPDPFRLPKSFPSFSSSSEALVFSDKVSDSFADFHEERKNDLVFAEPARTYATTMTFRSRDFLSIAPEPDEARLRSYFERNKESFDLPPPPPPPPPPALPVLEGNASEGEQGPVGEGDPNASSVQNIDLLAALNPESNASEKIAEVTFEDVREEVRQRIIEGDRIDAERDANDFAKEAASKFLLQLHQLSDDLNRKYASSYEQLRESPELSDLINKNNLALGQIDFSEQDMGKRGEIIGLEKRESEELSNSSPLQEVADLTKGSFYTRTIRKSRDGYVIFVLNKKTEKGPGTFSTASYSLLYREYAAQLKADAFTDLADRTFAALQGDSNVSLPSAGFKVAVEAKDSRLLRGYYEGANSRIGSRLEKLEKEREVISSSERESNATSSQLARKEVIDLEIEAIRARQSVLNKESSLGQKLVDACQGLEPDGKWSELERTQDTAVFVTLKSAYFLKQGKLDASVVEERVEDLQFSRAEKGRDLLLRDIIARELAQNQ